MNAPDFICDIIFTIYEKNNNQMEATWFASSISK